MVKNPPANARDARDTGSLPGSGRSPGVGNGNPLQHSCLENPMDRGVWQGGSQRVKHDWARMLQELYFKCKYILPGAFLVAQMVKNLPAMWETQVQTQGSKTLGWENPLEKKMATHSSILAWRIPWTEPGGLQSIGWHRVGHDWNDLACTHTYLMH